MNCAFIDFLLATYNEQIQLQATRLFSGKGR